MRLAVRLIRWFAVLIGLALVCVVAWLGIAPPDLLRVGTGYAAKMICSNVFIAGRDADEVLRLDVQAPGHPLLRAVGAEVDRERRIVTADLFGFAAPSQAIYREGTGCAVVPDGDLAAAANHALPSAGPSSQPRTGEWPDGEDVSAADPRLASILSNPELMGTGMRAVAVIKDGRLVGEAYGDGFSATTPLLGWSMTKTVNAALIGRMITEERMALSDRALFEGWAADRRSGITLARMLAMESGLGFREDYGAVADVTRMLYLEPDMAGYAGNLAVTEEAGGPDGVFAYSSGDAVLLSRLWMDRLDDEQTALGYPASALFDPLGMRSAVMEADARGTYVGSSYLYATTRDWARFGQFLLQDGVWKGARLLPEGFVAAMARPTAASGGLYTEIQAWHAIPRGGLDEASGPMIDALPEDAFWLLGHDGQSMVVVPSERLAVIRLGLTPSRLGYRPELLADAVRQALR